MPQFNGLTTVNTLTLGGKRFDITAGTTGFDILSNGGNVAYISNGNDLYTVDLGTGILTGVGTQSGPGFIDIAFAVPEPGSYALTTLGVLGLAWFAVRRRQRSATA